MGWGVSSTPLFHCKLLSNFFPLQPPFALEYTVTGYLHVAGQSIMLLGAIYLFFQGVSIFTVTSPTVTKDR